jgi:hypothetical protein
MAAKNTECSVLDNSYSYRQSVIGQGRHWWCYTRSNFVPYWHGGHENCRQKNCGEIFPSLERVSAYAKKCGGVDSLNVGLEPNPSVYRALQAIVPP